MSGPSIPWRVGMALPAGAFGAIVRIRNAWYDRPAVIRHASIPVISIGNLAVGGTGKSPLVAWIARRLAGDGVVPAVVSRGYGGTAGRGPVVVSTGEGPRVDVRVCGDEPHLLARTLPGAIVVVGADRVEGARAAAAAGAAVVLLDDGFQHRRLARDLDVVLLDGRSPFDGGRLLPAGTLREPPSSLARASLVVLTRLAERDDAAGAGAAVRATGFSGPIVRAGHRATGFFDVSGEARTAPAGAVAFCGIGDPGLFRTDLEAAGVTLAAFHAYRDHHVYSRADLDALSDEARRAGVQLITTEKDLSRLEPLLNASRAPVQLLVLRIETAVWDEGILLDAIRNARWSPAAGAAR